MSNVLDKSFIHRSYPKLAYGSINLYVNNKYSFGMVQDQCLKDWKLSIMQSDKFDKFLGSIVGCQYTMGIQIPDSLKWSKVV